jgi:hypothetical protein
MIDQQIFHSPRLAAAAGQSGETKQAKKAAIRKLNNEE